MTRKLIKSAEILLLQVISLSFRKTEKNSVVYTYSKAEEGEKSKPIQIEWSKRNDASEIAKVSGSRLFTVDTDYYQHRKELEDAGDEAGLTESNKKFRYFIAVSDFLDFARKVVNSDKTEDYTFQIRGNVNYNYVHKKNNYRTTSKKLTHT